MKADIEEYLSLRHITKKYDLHPDTIKKKALIEGVHYIKIDKTIRYHIKNMHSLLTENTDKNIISLDRFLID